MLRSKTQALAMFAITVLTSSSHAGNTMVVDDDGGSGVFTDIQAAIDASSNFSVILIKDGVYGGFTLDGEYRYIVAESGADVDCTGPVEIKNIHSAHTSIQGLDIAPPPIGPALKITNCSGGVFLDRCTMVGNGLPIFIAGQAAVVENADSVMFSSCQLSVASGAGPAQGLYQNDSNVALYGCDVTGGDGEMGLPGGDACLMVGGTLFASGCEFRGGVGSDGTVTSPFGLCTDGQKGGAGIVLSALGAPSEPIVRFVETDFFGGAGGAPGGTGCNSGPNGFTMDASVGEMHQLPGSARHFDITSPVREGKAGNLTIVGEPGDYVWFVASFAQSQTYVADLRGVMLPTLDQTLIPIGFLPANGVLHASLTVPVHASTDSYALMEQVVHWSSSTGFNLSNPRLSAILDKNF